jgi:amidase
LRELRIAWSDDFGIPVSSNVRLALTGFTEKLSRLGCHVQCSTPPEFDFAHALQVYGEIKEAAFTVRSSPLYLPRFLWRALSEQISRSNPTSRGLMRGAGATLQNHAAALSQRDIFISKIESFLTDWDVWLCPVAALPAYPHLKSRNPVEQLRATNNCVRLLNWMGKKCPTCWQLACSLAFLI